MRILTSTYTINNLVGQKLADYARLGKLRLTLSVVFSAVAGYLLATPAFDVSQLILLICGGALVTAGSNGLNQVLEKEYDALMRRTASRPLPAGRMTIAEAILVSGIWGISGILILGYLFNTYAGMLGAVALLSYTFLYTPLKRFTPLAVLVGAIPGSLPPLIGWVCATGGISYEAWLLFSIQFLWQFPHFWSIAWVASEDYLRAGFKLLPSKDGKNQSVAIQNLVYTLILIPVSLIPFVIGMTSWIYFVVALIAGLWFAYLAFKLFKTLNDRDALKLMFGSFGYLPLLFLMMIIDKFLIPG